MAKQTTYTLGSDVPDSEVLRDSKGRVVDDGYARRPSRTPCDKRGAVVDRPCQSRVNPRCCASASPTPWTQPCVEPPRKPARLARTGFGTFLPRRHVKRAELPRPLSQISWLILSTRFRHKLLRTEPDRTARRGRKNVAHLERDPSARTGQNRPTRECPEFKSHPHRGDPGASITEALH